MSHCGGCVKMAHVMKCRPAQSLLDAILAIGLASLALGLGLRSTVCRADEPAAPTNLVANEDIANLPTE